MKVNRLVPSLVRLAKNSCTAPIAPRSLANSSFHQAALRAFTTSNAKEEAINAAPEINFKVDEAGNLVDPRPFFARFVPESPSYFTGSPNFIDNLLTLEHLLRKYETLPTVKPGQAPRKAWRTLLEYRGIVGEPVKVAKYHKIVEILQRLNHIHPDLMPEDVKAALTVYTRDIDPHANVARPIKIDRFGRALGVGRRKASTATAYVMEGTGEVMVNGKNLAEAFARVHDRESAVWALKSTERLDKYNVWARAEGGGTTGQAEALTLAIAKALLAHEPMLKPALRRGRFIPISPCFVFCLVWC
jgi:small subunit ribosomal protein S9